MVNKINFKLLIAALLMSGCAVPSSTTAANPPDPGVVKDACKARGGSCVTEGVTDMGRRAVDWVTDDKRKQELREAKDWVTTKATEAQEWVEEKTK